MREQRPWAARRSLILGLLLMGLPAACQYNALEGSIDSELGLDFTGLQLRKQDDYLLIEYLRESQRGTEKVCKVVVQTRHLELPASGAFDLDGQRFLDHFELQRSTFVGDTFPAIDRGNLHFEAIEFRHAGYARGSFEVFFVNTRRLKGWFDGTIKEI
ncbi:MAG: hypothetical protein JXR83_03790 [Deltaproteobacteria bacterium]|nr:hypothetical protein [Deltaproteobacteria bacterium]